MPICHRPPDPARRNERARASILEAALELTFELGLAKVTIEGIAARAGVGKQTIYRWWPSKGAVVLDALLQRAETETPFPDSGDIVADLRTQMRTVVGFFDDPQRGPQYRALIAESQHDPGLADDLLNRLIRPRFAAAVERLRRAQQAGQIRDDVDPADAVELLYSPLYYRYLLRTAPVTPDRVDTIVDLVLRGLAPDGH